MTLSTHDRCLFSAFKSNRSFLPRLSNLVSFLVLPNLLSRDSWLPKGCDFWLVHDIRENFQTLWMMHIMHTSIIFTSYWLKIGTVRVREYPRVEWFRISRRIWSMTSLYLAKTNELHRSNKGKSYTTGIGTIQPSTMSPNHHYISLDTKVIPKNMTQKLPLFLQNKHKRS